MKQRTPTKTSQKTRLQNLVQHRSGRYYARAFANGKEVWKSLKASHFSVAQAKRAEFLREHRARLCSRRGRVATSVKMTFVEAAALHLETLDAAVLRKAIKPRTRTYWAKVLAALLKSWPKLEGLQIRDISSPDCKRWAANYSTAVSATRYNNIVAMLRHVLAVALDEGVVYTNAGDGVDRSLIRNIGASLPALAMKTYGHLRREHSIAQAQKVAFAHRLTGLPGIINFAEAAKH